MISVRWISVISVMLAEVVGVVTFNVVFSGRTTSIDRDINIGY